MSRRHKPVDLHRLAGQQPAKPGDFASFDGYRDDPVAYAVEVLGVHPWARQAEFLRAVAEHDRVAVKAGHKVSKSCSLAILALWFYCTRPGARVIFTNSGARQVRTVNWREVRLLYRRALIPIPGTLNDRPDNGLVSEDGAREILGFATDIEDAWGGISGENLLFIVDEGSGVPENIFDAINANAAGDNAKMVVCGNPLRPAGYFYECWASRVASWHTLTISSLETPNYVDGHEVIRGLAGRRWVAQMAEDYGQDSPLYQTRVLGEFAQQSEYAVIGLADVLAAAARFETMATTFAQSPDPLVIGLDCARFGDDESAAVVRRGSIALPPVTFRNLDGPGLASKVAELALQHRREHERVRVNVDVIGVGASPYDALKSYAFVYAVPVNVAESPTRNDHYCRLRDQLWFECARWLKSGGCVPNDRKLHGELTAPLYSFDANGDRKVEGKDAIKKKIRRSPDRADALCLALHGDAPLAQLFSPDTYKRLQRDYEEDRLAHFERGGFSAGRRGGIL